jgi:hypothetical protein
LYARPVAEYPEEVPAKSHRADDQKTILVAMAAISAPITYGGNGCFPKLAIF